MLPGLRNKHVELQPVYPHDLETIYELMVLSPVSFRWRYRGSLPPFEEFVRSFTHNVLVDFVVAPLSDPNRRIGYVVGYSPDMRSQHCSVAVIMAPQQVDTGLGVEATAVLIDYLFRGWPFRKLYFEGTDFTLGAIKSGLGRYFRQEGCFCDHEYLDDRWWDLETYAIVRDDWVPGPAALQRLLRPAREGARAVLPDHPDDE